MSESPFTQFMTDAIPYLLILPTMIIPIGVLILWAMDRRDARRFKDNQHAATPEQQEPPESFPRIWRG